MKDYGEWVINEDPFYGKDEITNMLESFAKAADIINQLSDKL